MTSKTEPSLGHLLEGTPYRAVRRLASGGMGEIYEAVCSDGRDRVVVKLLRADHAGQADMVDRMRVEGEALALLAHPNIVAALGHGTTAAGRPYLAMEYVDGETLQSLLRRSGPLPLAQAIHVIRRLLSALEAVHEAGIVHRDIKPDNIMVMDADETTFPPIKLLDFGVAKISRSEGHPIAPLAFPTMVGACVGTPRYASPEQARGASVDARADLYAVGIVLYTMVAGRGPFDEIKGAGNLLRAHAAQEPPAPSRVTRRPIPAPLEAVILRAIAKDPNDRFADARTFSRALLLTVGKMCLPLDGVATRIEIAVALASPRSCPGSLPSSRKANDLALEPIAPSVPSEAFAVGTRPAATRSRRGRGAVGVSARDVLLSAAAFATLAGVLAMWFVR